MSSWPSWISHFNGSFIQHSRNDTPCPRQSTVTSWNSTAKKKIQPNRSFTSIQTAHTQQTHTHTHTSHDPGDPFFRDIEMSGITVRSVCSAVQEVAWQGGECMIQSLPFFRWKSMGRCGCGRRRRCSGVTKVQRSTRFRKPMMKSQGQGLCPDVDDISRGWLTIHSEIKWRSCMSGWNLVVLSIVKQFVGKRSMSRELEEEVFWVLLLSSAE